MFVTACCCSQTCVHFELRPTLPPVASVHLLLLGVEAQFELHPSLTMSFLGHNKFCDSIRKKSARLCPSLTLSRIFITSVHFLHFVWLKMRDAFIDTLSGFLVKFHPQAVLHSDMLICQPAFETLCHVFLPFLLSVDATHKLCLMGLTSSVSFATGSAGGTGHILAIGVMGALADGV